jgi:hypothetical protein
MGGLLWPFTLVCLNLIHEDHKLLLQPVVGSE